METDMGTKFMVEPTMAVTPVTAEEKAVEAAQAGVQETFEQVVFEVGMNANGRGDATGPRVSEGDASVPTM